MDQGKCHFQLSVQCLRILSACSSFRFPKYSVVEIIDDSDKLKALQTSDHGGFNNKMILACGIRGIVNKVKSGSVCVECVNGDE